MTRAFHSPHLCLFSLLSSTISIFAQADSEVAFDSLLEYSTGSIVGLDFEKLSAVNLGMTMIQSQDGIMQAPGHELSWDGRRLVRSKSRGSAGASSVAAKDAKQFCSRGFDSCTSSLSTYTMPDYSSEGSWLQDVLRLAGRRRRRGTFLQEQFAGQGCMLDSGANEVCAITMQTGTYSCNWLNLAAGKPVNASSDQAQPTSSNAVDGLAETHWMPQEMGAQPNGTYWLTIDLGFHVDLCRMVTGMNQWKGSYRVEGSDDHTTWRTLASHTHDQAWTGLEFPVGSKARWVRISSEKYMSIYEVELYEVRPHPSRRLQDSTIHQQCGVGALSATACCEACMQCTTLTCAIAMPNCTTFLSSAYMDCSEIKVDMHCCKALWWAFATFIFVTAGCMSWCFCVYLRRSRHAAKRIQEAQDQIAETSKFEL